MKKEQLLFPITNKILLLVLMWVELSSFLAIKMYSSFLRVTACNFTFLLKSYCLQSIQMWKMNFHASYEYGNQSIKSAFPTLSEVYLGTIITCLYLFWSWSFSRQLLKLCKLLWDITRELPFIKCIFIRSVLWGFVDGFF